MFLDIRSHSLSSLLSFTSSAVWVKMPRVREVGGGQMWPLWPYFCSYYRISICTDLIIAHLQQCQERVWWRKTIHISNFQQLSESHTSLFTLNLWAVLPFCLCKRPSKKQQVLPALQTVTHINSGIFTWSNVNDFLNNCILSLFILFPVLYIFIIDGTQFAVNKTRVFRSCDVLPSPTMPNFWPPHLSQC